MSHYNRLFLSAVVVLGVSFACPSMAVPSVKKLGANTNSVTPVKTTNSSTKSSRIGSLRNNRLSTMKPATVTKTIKTGNADERLSVGKYIHTTGVTSGVIKPVVSTESAGVSSNDIVSLSDRISDLSTIVDGKQDILTAGDGIVIENNTISVSEDIAALPEAVDEINYNLSQNYYTKQYVDQIISQLSGLNVVNNFDPSFLHHNQNQEQGQP